MVLPTPKRMMWRVTEAPWRMLQRSLCCSFAAFSWFWGLVSSQYLILTRWMLRRGLLRSLLSGVCGSTGGWRCCWGAPSLPQLPPATLKNPPPTLVCCFCLFAAMGVTSTKSGRLEVNPWIHLVGVAFRFANLLPVQHLVDLIVIHENCVTGLDFAC